MWSPSLAVEWDDINMFFFFTLSEYFQLGMKRLLITFPA